ncbi:hypothetical protein K4K60_009924 [Colletotrichum sp. SAR11_57]|nr:hypothetical protein K4K60_009924 [Colletotrichum sp. SAR11_57]
MKATAVFALLGAALVSAQETTQSSPFYLKYVPRSEPSCKGTYLASCHSGAGQAGLCPERSTNGSAQTHSEYFWNMTTSSSQPTLGPLIWNLPIGNGDPVPTTLDLQLQLVSNGAIPIFSPGTTGIYSFGFDDDNNELFIYSRQDDSKAVPDKVNYTAEKYYRWHVCWTFVGNYYYQALVWVTGGAPVNPTCQEVRVFREEVSK